MVYRTKIYRNDDPYKTQPMCYTPMARVCMQNFAAMHRAVSEEIADRHVNQLSVIIHYTDNLHNGSDSNVLFNEM